ncbi:MAG: response regulator transcription factor [Desulfovibrionaceae bacterium]|jgi:two-component system, OmpR family, phosphate regulon response regulator PhoB|nr:response regulator transcription factor [Desulfovibrionaceae bacterium]
MPTERILIVEDEDDIRGILAFNLEREGYVVFQAADGAQGLALAKAHKPHLALLDVMLPGMDGFALCRELERDPATANTALVMLTARGEEVDRIVGLELGADDYVVKPFSMRELLLRIKIILRRRQHAESPQPLLERHAICVDSTAHTVKVQGQPVAFTATEFRLLEDLLRHAGAVRTREQLLDNVWGYQFEGYGRTVDTHVRRVRAKLGDAADMLETVRGVGYRIKE